MSQLNHQSSQNPYSDICIPPRVGVALQFLGFGEAVRNGLPNRYNGEPTGGRELSNAESDVYDSALTVLLEYFNERDVSEAAQFILGPKPEEPPPPKPSEIYRPK